MEQGAASRLRPKAPLRQSVRFSEMPPDARAAWSHKATNEGAQVDIDDLFGVPDEVLSLMSE